MSKLNLNRTTLQELTQHPNVRKFLDLIALSEGVRHGYNTNFGNTKVNNLSAHPNNAVPFKRGDKLDKSTAFGRYQFIKPTWDDVARRYNLPDMQPIHQDMGAIVLMNDHGALQHVINGDFHKAIGRLGNTWVSFPTGGDKNRQPKHDWATMNKFIRQVGANPSIAPLEYNPVYSESDMLGMMQGYSDSVKRAIDTMNGLTYEAYQPQFYIPANVLKDVTTNKTTLERALGIDDGMSQSYLPPNLMGGLYDDKPKLGLMGSLYG